MNKELLNPTNEHASLLNRRTFTNKSIHSRNKENTSQQARTINSRNNFDRRKGTFHYQFFCAGYTTRVIGQSFSQEVLDSILGHFE